MPLSLLLPLLTGQNCALEKSVYVLQLLSDVKSITRGAQT